MAPPAESTMNGPAARRTPPTRRVLDPEERIAEVLFGLIMVLTFTGSLSIAKSGRDDVRTMLIGALGCNFAWGIIDAVFYLMGCLADKGRDVLTWRAIRAADEPREAQALLAEALPPFVMSAVQPAELERVSERLRTMPGPPARVRLAGSDWRGALGVFLLVFLSTFPVAIPFIFMRNTWGAMRVSNAVAIAMLFIAGVAYGRVVDRSPWLVGVFMVGLGSALVAVTMALGG